MSDKRAKTKVVMRKKLNIKRTFLLILFLCALFFGVKELTKVKVSGVIVNGNEFLNSSEIIKKAGLNSDTYFLDVRKKKVCSSLNEMSLVNSCNIKRTWDFKIIVEINENKPLFYYKTDSKLALSDGSLVSEENTYGVPTLINYVPEKVLSEFMSGLSDIKSDIIRSISEIEYTPSTSSNGDVIDEERFMLSMNDGNIVYINNKHMSVLNDYDKIYASIGDKKGYYNFDCDYNNYYFEEFES